MPADWYRDIMSALGDIRSGLARVEVSQCALVQRLEKLEQHDSKQDEAITAGQLLKYRIIYWAVGAAGIIGVVGGAVGLVLGVQKWL